MCSRARPPRCPPPCPPPQAHNNGAPVTEENLKNTLLSQAGQGGTKMEVDWVRVWGRRT